METKELGFLDVDNFHTVVITANRAHAVRTLCRTAMIAGSERRSFELPVRTTLVTTGCRCFSFWYGHFELLIVRPKSKIHPFGRFILSLSAFNFSQRGSSPGTSDFSPASQTKSLSGSSLTGWSGSWRITSCRTHSVTST